MLVRRAGSIEALYSSDQMSGKLPLLGLLVTYGVDSPWKVITQDDVLALDEKALNELLTQGALLDCTAAEALGLRGQASRIGVTVGDAYTLDELGYEQFSDAGISAELHGRRRSIRPFVKAGDWRRLQAAGTHALRIVSEIYDYRDHYSGPAFVLTENKRGERFAVLAHDGRDSRHLMENALRAEQVRNTLAWIARRPLPVCTHHSCPYLWPIVNRTSDSKIVIGVINLATDPYETLPLLMVSDLASLPIRRLAADGALSLIQPSGRQALTSGVERVALPLRIESFEVIVLVIG